MNHSRILIVDDNPGVLSAGKLLLKRHFAAVETTRDPAEIPDLMAADPFDLILLDMNFGRPPVRGGRG